MNARAELREGRLRLAVPNKGRLAEPSIILLHDCGYRFESDERRLFAPCENFPMDLLFVRAEDIPEYTQDGVVDLGITGSNLVQERGGRVIEGARLGFGRCSLQVAVPEDRGITRVEELRGRGVATSHPLTTARFFKERNVPVELIEISGAVEITPLLGVADAVVDLVSTGTTLAVNGLRAIETILESQAEVIVCPDLSEHKTAQVQQVDTMLRSVIAARNRKYLMLNAPEAALEAIRSVLPGLEAPTVMRLAEADMIAVHAVVDADSVWDLLSPLKAAGASGILVLPIERLIP